MGLKIAMGPEIADLKPGQEELSPFHRKRFRTGARYNIPPLGALLRTEIRQVGGIIAKLGQDMVIASHEEPTLLHVVRACAEAVEDAQEKNLEYRRKASERQRKWNEEARQD